MHLILVYMLITVTALVLIYLCYSVYKMIRYETEVKENFRKFKENMIDER